MIKYLFNASRMTWLLLFAYPYQIAFADLADQDIGIIDIFREQPSDSVGYQVYRKEYITLNGYFQIDPIDYYEWTLYEAPGYFDEFVNPSPSNVNFKMTLEYFGLGNESYTDTIDVPVNSGIYKSSISGGRYDDIRFKFWQDNPLTGGVTQTGEAYDLARIYSPVIRKVPLYFQTQAINIPWADSAESNSLNAFYNPALLAERIGFEVSRAAMYLYTITSDRTEDHVACPVLYEFMFMGYVSDFLGGIVVKEDMDRLPEGLTIVTDIIACDNETPRTKPGDDQAFTLGCANGGRIAVDIEYLISLLGTQERTFSFAALHELGHSWGLGHSDDDDTTNFMNGSLTADRPYVSTEQCLVLGGPDPLQFFGFKPWE